MFNLNKFLNCEVAYVVDKDNVVELLTKLETHSNVNWLSGVKPTEYNPFESCCIQDDDVITVGMFKHIMDCTGIGYGEKWWFESNNYKVEEY